MADTQRRVTSLDLVVVVLTVAALLIAAYEYNLASLGRRLVRETQAWLAEQRPSTPSAPDVSRETMPLAEQEMTPAERVEMRAEQDMTEQMLAERGPQYGALDEQQRADVDALAEQEKALAEQAEPLGEQPSERGERA